MNRKVHVRFGGGPLEKYPYGQLAGSLSYLTLPSETALPFGEHDALATLADGSTVALADHEGVVARQRAPGGRPGLAQGDPLNGMLHGSRLTMDVVRVS